MKFAHFADVHIGSWRDIKLGDISTKAFLAGIDICKKEKVDFILISGDIFNTALPSIDRLKEVVGALKELKDTYMPVYIIAGSHDYSPTGKTMLDVLEQAGLFTNVMRGEVVDGKLKLAFTVDEKTGAKITGIIGRAGMLDRHYYEALDKKPLEQEIGFKIFMFHTALSEFKPKELEKMEAAPLSLLPSGFDYYAGGHVHYVFSKEEEGYGPITYPGPVFPNNFRELEKLKGGGFYLVEAEDKVTYRHIPLIINPVESFTVDCHRRKVSDVAGIISERIRKADLKNAIVTLRLAGVLSEGKPSDIAYGHIFEEFYSKGAFFVMKNTAELKSEEFVEIKQETKTIDEIEQEVIAEHIGQISLSGYTADQEKTLTSSLFSTLSMEKDEGETTATYEQRLKDDIERLLKIRL